MATSKQQSLITAIVERLQTIDGSGDYDTDFRRHVEDSRTDWGDNDDENTELPAISLFQLPTEIAEEIRHGKRRTVHVMPVQIKIFVKRGETAENVRQANADVMLAILGTGTQSDNWLGERFPDADGIGYAMETRPRRHGIEYAQDSFEIAAGIVEIEITYITDKWSI